MDIKRFAALVSLGCSKNQVDSETMIPQLLQLGYEMTSDLHKASLLLVNTCGFLESAVEEAIQTILELGTYKESGSCKCLVVTGCMVQRYGKKLLELLPEVDLFFGTSHYNKVKDALHERKKGNPRRLWISTPLFLPDSRTPRVCSSAGHSSYIKIAEGCNNRCSFCLIPNLRGRYRSRSIDDVIEEASRFVSQGTKEINIIAQDTTAFGSDRGDRHALARLLDSMDRIEGLEWIRLLYTYPGRIDELLLRTMAGCEKFVPYLDVPLQHCVPDILEAMGRRGPYGDYERLFELIRGLIPDVALRTSLIVGFPGETEREFQMLVDFVRRIEFDHVGVFTFSPEPGTKAARLPFQIDQETKEKRRHILLEVQRDISSRLMRRLPGMILPVLIEGPHPETDFLLVGRLPTQAPEVDGTVIITSGSAHAGQIVPARITASHDYDVEAVLLTSPENAHERGADSHDIPGLSVKRFDFLEKFR